MSVQMHMQMRCKLDAVWTGRDRGDDARRWRVTTVGCWSDCSLRLTASTEPSSTPDDLTLTFWPSCQSLPSNLNVLDLFTSGNHAARPRPWYFDLGVKDIKAARLWPFDLDRLILNDHVLQLHILTPRLMPPTLQRSWSFDLDPIPSMWTPSTLNVVDKVNEIQAAWPWPLDLGVSAFIHAGRRPPSCYCCTHCRDGCCPASWISAGGGSPLLAPGEAGSPPSILWGQQWCQQDRFARPRPNDNTNVDRINAVYCSSRRT